MGIIEIEKERLEWSLKTFTEATPLGSLEKAKEEIGEIEDDIKNGIKDPFEFADAIMCIFDVAGRIGISPEDIELAYKHKFEINRSRTWVKNEDNSYSHVKSNPFTRCLECGKQKMFGLVCKNPITGLCDISSKFLK